MKATIETDIDLIFEKLNDQVHEIIEDEMVVFHNELIDVGEKVKDTGNFKNSFSPITKESTWVWYISNDAPYASILARGRHVIRGKEYGSLNWKKGLTPMLRKVERRIKQKTDRIVL